ncbi:ricin B-like lectin R40C1 [Tripterygium wilfordii]|uniref:ricin B-like lectin R40C1 n=1 Tax=Tripterygium wilfordii TaxID=458696 RepID=UPI0018F82380|nr:ricin B-like lectin R40C1 [Tripterygium wilfordii]
MAAANPNTVSCKAYPGSNLAVRDNENRPYLAPANPNDPHQQWYKYGNENAPFSLVNKASNQALQHLPDYAIVTLVPYNPPDESVLWALGQVDDEGYGPIITPHVALYLEADDGGATIKVGNFVYENDNQLWKLSPTIEYL